jgi:hypothetical protein
MTLMEEMPSQSTGPMADAIEAEIARHVAMRELSDFGASLLARPLSLRENILFFATMRAFFQEIPGGILALALRVTDDWNRLDPYEGTAKGAFILLADVEEFGLHGQNKALPPTHHQHLRTLTGHLGITLSDLST